MKTTRAAALLASSLLLTAGGGYASAAPKPKPVKPVCNLVVDEEGDAYFANGDGVDGDDIVSADVASDGVTITGVVRTAALAAADPQAPLGRAYFAEFKAPGRADVLFLAGRTYATGNEFVFGVTALDPTTGWNVANTLGTATGVVDVLKGEVRISAPLRTVAEGAKVRFGKGTKLTNLSARTARIFGHGVVPAQNAPTGQRLPLGGIQLQTDDADTFGGSYVLGTPSCVPVGK